MAVVAFPIFNSTGRRYIDVSINNVFYMEPVKRAPCYLSFLIFNEFSKTTRKWQSTGVTDLSVGTSRQSATTCSYRHVCRFMLATNYQFFGSSGWNGGDTVPILHVLLRLLPSSRMESRRRYVIDPTMHSVCGWRRLMSRSGYPLRTMTSFPTKVGRRLEICSQVENWQTSFGVD